MITSIIIFIVSYCVFTFLEGLISKTIEKLDTTLTWEKYKLKQKQIIKRINYRIT